MKPAKESDAASQTIVRNLPGISKSATPRGAQRVRFPALRRLLSRGAVRFSLPLLREMSPGQVEAAVVVMEMNSSNHDHHHGPNRFAVIPTHVRLNADPDYTGKGVTVAFLDSGFYPHPDLLLPKKRTVAYKDLSNERPSLDPKQPVEPWQWHGTQTSVVAAGSGYLCEAVYKGLACESDLILVKASEKGSITEEKRSATSREGPSAVYLSRRYGEKRWARWRL